MKQMQILLFAKLEHPFIADFHQCINIACANSPLCITENSSIRLAELTNTVINFVEAYLLPFVVIIVCYSGETDALNSCEDSTVLQ